MFVLNLNVNNVKAGMKRFRMTPELSMSVSSVDFLTSLIALLGLHQHMHIIKQLTNQQIKRSIDLKGMLRTVCSAETRNALHASVSALYLLEIMVIHFHSYSDTEA